MEQIPVKPRENIEVSQEVIAKAAKINLYMPIKALSPLNRDWKIQARVANKSEKRTTNAGRSLLKIGLVDTYGT